MSGLRAGEPQSASASQGRFRYTRQSRPHRRPLPPARPRFGPASRVRRRDPTRWPQPACVGSDCCRRFRLSRPLSIRRTVRVRHFFRTSRHLQAPAGGSPAGHAPACVGLNYIAREFMRQPEGTADAQHRLWATMPRGVLYVMSSAKRLPESETPPANRRV